MSGHFRRLREHARVIYLEPLVSGGGLNIRQTKDLLRNIVSGDLEQTVFDEVSRSLPSNDRLESQHRLQLTRYLKGAAKQFDAAIRAEAGKIDIRTIDFADRLEEAIDGMTGNGPPGSIGWLEGEFLACLRGNPGAKLPEPNRPALWRSPRAATNLGPRYALEVRRSLEGGEQTPASMSRSAGPPAQRR